MKSDQDLRTVPNALNLFCLFFEWFLIFALAYFASGSVWWIQLLAIFLIGSRQHALGILMHEASHFRFLSDRAWNDRIAQIFLAAPALIDLRQYRAQHLSHHSFNQTEKDQQYSRKKNHWIFNFPKSKGQVFALSAGLLMGLGLLQVLRDLTRTWKKKTTQAASLLRLAFVVVLLIGFYNLGWLDELVLFWLVPVFTVFPLLNFWRTVAEHLAIPDGSKKTRSLRLNPMAAWIFTPYNIHYHGEHHSDPSVSWIHLPLKEPQIDVWETKGLVSFFKECSSFKKA